jgi:hypothetical protein
MAADRSIKLGLLNSPEHYLNVWPRSKTKGKEVIPRDQPRWPNLLRGGLRQEAADEFIAFEIPMAREAIQSVKLEVLLKSRKAHEPLQSREPHLRHILES